MRRFASSSGSPGPESLGGGRSCREAEAPLFLPPPISLYSTAGEETDRKSISLGEKVIYRSNFIFPNFPRLLRE